MEDTPKHAKSSTGRGGGWRAVALCLAVPIALGVGVPAAPAPVVVLARTARDSMAVFWRRYNQHWDELQDLNQLERMLGTVRPTQLEYMGCLVGRVQGDTVRVEAVVAARNLRQLPLAVTGDCDGVARLVGTWHTHPFRADAANHAIKTPALSAQDLATFGASGYRVTLVMWDVDSVDAAVRDGRDSVVHPAAVVLRDSSSS